MIRINLGTKKQNNLSSGPAMSGGGSFEQLKSVRLDFDELKDLPIIPLLGALGILVGGYIGTTAYEQAKIAAANAKIEKIQEETNLLNRELSKMAQYEELKKQLEKDEFVLKSKIDTIEKLITGRKNAVRTLMVLPEIIPSNVWIKSFQLSREELLVKGLALDYKEVNEFLQKLGESSYIANLNPVNQQQTRDPDTNLELVDFELKANRREVLGQ